MLRGREPAPRGERRRVREPGGVAHLAGEQVRGGDVDALHAPERVDDRPPFRTRGGFGDPARERVPGLLAAPHAAAVVLVGGGVVGLAELDRVGPPPVRAGPVALPPAGRRRLVEGVAVPQQELRHPLLGALQVVAGVRERAGEVAGGLGAPVGHPHLRDVARGEEPREELRVAPVGLPAAVRRRALHLGDGPHRAVQAEGAQRAAEVEAGDAGLVDGHRRLEAEGSFGDRRGVVAEGGAPDLAGHGVEGAGLDAAGVDVETDGCDIIGHGAPPQSHVARGHGCRCDHCRPTHEGATRGGAPNVQLISSLMRVEHCQAAE